MRNYDTKRQHDKGKLHAMERIDALLDEGSFREVGTGITNIDTQLGLKGGTLPYDGVITGYGTIDGRRVCIYSQDFTVAGGTLGHNHGQKIASIINMAGEYRCPLIGINDSGGARIQEGVASLASYGDIFFANTAASGCVPQISIIAGPCAGGAVYSPGITDFIFMVNDIGNMFVTGPKVIKQVTNETVSTEDLGGAKVHGTVNLGSAEILGRNRFVGNLLYNLGSCNEHVADVVDHEYEVGNAGRVNSAAGTGTCDDRNLGNAARSCGVCKKDVAVRSKRSNALLNTGSAGIVDADQRTTVFASHINYGSDLLSVVMTEGSAGHSEILRIYAYASAIDRAVACDDTVVRKGAALKSELCVDIGDTGTYFAERAFVKKSIDPLHSVKLTLVMLSFSIVIPHGDLL